MAGRLRTRWLNLHSDEVFFRDTAHGFLAWALGTVLVAIIAAMAASSAIGGATSAVTSVMQGAAQGATQGAVQRGNATGFSPADYLIDRAFRPAPGAAPSAATLAGEGQNAAAEAVSILAYDLTNGDDVSTEDRAYLAQIVAARTGLPEADAARRVDELVTAAKFAKAQAIQAADDARKAAATAALFTALSLVIGAFVACAAGALGGRMRDED
jgi:hypothetical protein